MREWQFVTGMYEPTNMLKYTRYFSLFPEQLESLSKTIVNQERKLICINDAKVDDFSSAKQTINEAFKKILPNKSGFEL